MRPQRIVSGAGLLGLAVCLAGCGSAVRPTAPGAGSATITIQWPETSRLIPAACASIKLQASRATPAWTMPAKSVDRPPAGGKSVVVLENLPVGDVLVTVTAHPQAGGAGTAQAQASKTVAIRDGADTPFAVTMASTVDHLDVALPSTVLFTDGTMQLTATARSAAPANAVVLVGSLRWQSGDLTVAQVSSSGKVTPVGSGTARVTVTEPESGKSKTVTVAVKQRFSGTVTGAATWKGIVYLTGDVMVPAGSSLTIQPGTRVEAEPNVDDRVGGMNTSRIEVIVDGGTLTSQGTSASPILFTSAGATPAPGDWYAVRAKAGTTALAYCTIEYGKQGLRIEGGQPTVTSCSFRRNEEAGIDVSAAATLTRCTVSNNRVGVNSFSDRGGGDGITVTANACAIQDNTGDGIHLGGNGRLVSSGGTVTRNGGAGVYAEGGGRLDGVVVSNNAGKGITAGGWGGDLALVDTTVEANGDHGISDFYNLGVISLTNSKVTNNRGSGIDNSTYGGAMGVRLNNSVLSGNTGSGVVGAFYQGLQVQGCVVADNGSDGICQLAGAYTDPSYGYLAVSGSSVVRNGGRGIVAAWLSAVGVTGNLVTGNRIGIQAASTSTVLSGISGNDVFGNTEYELYNGATAAVTANGNYWGDPTTAELAAHQANPTKIHDSRDTSTVGQVVITQWQSTRVTTLAVP